MPGCLVRMENSAVVLLHVLGQQHSNYSAKIIESAVVIQRPARFRSFLRLHCVLFVILGNTFLFLFEFREIRSS